MGRGLRTAGMAAGVVALTLTGCARAPAEDPQFSDATKFAFRAFDAPEADLAFALRALEGQIYLSMDVEASSEKDRALTPSRLTANDVRDIEHPDSPPEEALAVAVAGVSTFEIADHALIPLLPDQTPLEPYSPETFDRIFFEGTEDCWQDRGCDTLLTRNDLVKENLLMTVPYTFFKDFRWIDMNLPDPSTVDEGEEPVNTGDPRWSYVARSWMTESAEGENGNARIIQSFTIEVWVPRDGQGFVRDGSEQNFEDGEWTHDSTGGGTLRMLALWSHSEFDGISFTEDQVAATTRRGIDDNLKAHEEWLTETFAAE